MIHCLYCSQLTPRGHTGEREDGVKLVRPCCVLHFSPAEVYYCDRGRRLYNTIRYSILSRFCY